MKDLLNSLKDTVNDRIRNPLLGAFIFAWFVFNWKPILFFLLSDQKVEERIGVIEKKYDSFHETFLYPFIFALGYVIVVQYVIWISTYLARRGIKLRKHIAMRNRVDDLRNQITISQLEIELEDVRARHRDTAALNDRIGLLEAELNTQQQSLMSSERDRKLLLLELKHIQESLLTLQQLVSQQSSNDYIGNLEENVLALSDFEKLTDTSKNLFFRTLDAFNQEDGDGLFKIFADNSHKQEWKSLVDQGFIRETGGEFSPIDITTKGWYIKPLFLESRVKALLNEIIELSLFDSDDFSEMIAED